MTRSVCWARRPIVACVLLALTALPSAAGVSSAYERVNASAEAYLHYSLARLMETSGLLSEALVQYRRAASLDPEQCEIDTAIARVLLSMGRVEEARELSEGLLARCGGDEIVALAASAMMTDGDHERAADLLRGPAHDGEGPRELVALLGRALLSQGRLEEALAVYRRRAAADTMDPEAAYLHARALLAADRFDDAAVELERAYRLDPDNRHVKLMLGRVLIATGDTADAIIVLEELATAPDARETEHLTLARAYGIVGDLETALVVLEGAIAEHGETAGLLTMLGSIQFDRGCVEEALAAYERVLVLTPESVQALNFVAYTLADMNRDVERSIALAEKAVGLDPESGLVRDTLGWAYFRAGRFEEAAEEIGRAVQLGEDDPVIHEHLGDALDALGRTAEAVEAWRRALDLDPERASAAARIEAARGDEEPAQVEEGGTE